jgi:integrase
LLLVIEGIGRAKSDGRSVLQAYGLASYDDASGKYHMRAFNDGRWLETETDLTDNGKGLTWGFTIGDVRTKSIMRLTDAGEWTESHENVRMPRAKTGKKKNKPHVTPEQFAQIINDIQEPYATMVYVSVWTGLRVSELAALRWEDVHEDSLTIDERYCRGDWGAPKSDASNATIGADLEVIKRIHRLKELTVTVRAGRAK